MIECAGCGTTGTGLFCGTCGRSLRADDSPLIFGINDPADHAPIAAENTSVGEPNRIRSKRWFRLVAVGAVVAVGLGLFIGISRPDDPAAPDSAASEGEQGGTTASGNEPELIVAGGPSTTTRPQSTPGVETDESKWLGRDVPWNLLVYDLSSLNLIDLNTGVVTDLEVAARPLGMIDGRVVLLHNSRLVLADPAVFDGSEPVQLPEPLSDETFTLSPSAYAQSSNSPDHFWIIPRRGGSESLEIEVATGQISDRANGDDSFFGPFAASTPVFRSPLSGGVYQRARGGDYRRIADGRLVSETADAILVLQCGEALQCGYRWLDSMSLEPRDDLFAPAFDDSFPAGGTFGQGTFVASRFDLILNIHDGSVLRVELDADVFDLAPDGSAHASVRFGRLAIEGVGGVRQQPEVSGLAGDTRPIFLPQLSRE